MQVALLEEAHLPKNGKAVQSRSFGTPEEEMKYTKEKYYADLKKAREDMLNSIGAEITIYMNKIQDLQNKRVETIKEENRLTKPQDKTKNTFLNFLTILEIRA